CPFAQVFRQVGKVRRHVPLFKALYRYAVNACTSAVLAYFYSFSSLAFRFRLACNKCVLSR
ncbi:MAG: hypothetical protein LBD53_05505, partial [Tannerella sp.]|nr:hypothetical protein [Tannerella sp.]